METFEQKPIFDVKASLEKVDGVSDVQKVEFGEKYLNWAKTNFSPELYEAFVKNYETLDAYKYKYLSDGLIVTGYMWTPKNMKEALPLAVWNRGGTREFGCIGEKPGTAYTNTACDLAHLGYLVVASEYRGSIGSEGKDEWGGADLHDVVRVKEVADELPMQKKGKAVVAGVSRGGMMSYLLASKEPWVKGVISIAGEADLLYTAKDDPQFKKEVFDTCFDGSEEEMKKRSATHFYNEIPKDLPLLILQGAKDDRVKPEQVRNLNQLLVASGHNVEYHEFREADHYFASPGRPERKEALEIIEKFLKKIN